MYWEELRFRKAKLRINMGKNELSIKEVEGKGERELGVGISE